MSTINHDHARNLAHYIIASDHGNEDALTLARAYIERCEQVRELCKMLYQAHKKGTNETEQLARILGAEDAP